MEVTARGAVETDLTFLAALVDAGLTVVRGERGAELWALEHGPREPVEAELRRALGEPDRAVIAGCVDDVPVGILLLDRRVLMDGRAIARITFVFVDPLARGIGVGEALVGRALVWATGHDCAGLDAVVLPGDRETKNLYERSGLTAREITVHRELGR